jgi:hypothetical protein
MRNIKLSDPGAKAKALNVFVSTVVLNNDGSADSKPCSPIRIDGLNCYGKRTTALYLTPGEAVELIEALRWAVYEEEKNRAAAA